MKTGTSGLGEEVFATSLRGVEGRGSLVLLARRYVCFFFTLSLAGMVIPLLRYGGKKERAGKEKRHVAPDLSFKKGRF